VQNKEKPDHEVRLFFFGVTYPRNGDASGEEQERLAILTAR